MASLLRVSLGFARAARLVAAPVPRLGSGGAGPSDLPGSRRLSFLRGGFTVDSPPLGRAMSSHTDGPSPPASGISGTTNKGVVGLVADDRDLESDEALWALYKRWCKELNQKRDHDEMVRRFPKFKETAIHVNRVNKANLPYKLWLSKFADGKLREAISYPLIDFLKDMPCSEGLMFATAKGILFERDCPGTGDERKDGHPKGTGHESNLA